jgi:predicted phage terminase large subunit-like protein
MVGEQIKPQPGPQEIFLSSPADFAVYGGAAGGGKTWALLLEPLRHIANSGFGAVIFRRNSVQVRNEGGLWDESAKLYPLIQAEPQESILQWKFPAGAKLKFAHLEHEKNKHDWQGSQIPFIGFDELTHFSMSQVFYMLSRNRSTCGVRPYVRATCNPDADSWVAQFIAWYIDQDTGLPIPERSGIIRWFTRRADEIIWGDNKEELLALYPDLTEHDVKSFTFIAANIYDNKILLEKDPGYLANLKAQSLVERERLLNGNWKIRPSAGLYFKRSYFEIIDAAPATTKRVRCWDLAATAAEDGKDPDWTVGMKASRDLSGIIYIEHVERMRESPEKVERAIINTAGSDGAETRIRLPEDPGQAGKSQARHLIRRLVGYTVKSKRVTGSKVTRAAPASSQAEAGNIKLVRGQWNEAFLAEAENFPPTGNGHDDQIDALSDCVEELSAPAAMPSIRSL